MDQDQIREQFQKAVSENEAEAGARVTYQVVCQTIKDPNIKQNYENIGALVEKSPRAAIYALAQIHAMAAALHTGTSIEEINGAIDGLYAKLTKEGGDQSE